ncbi:hypothetical protein [Marinomonas sp. GJ51-6]|uniref:hypothetical protein n=1 Tax=Marinomonas sp. GJ51-6 TaxID=2992802 RepID=UPI002934155C|nr:hypothetical protein [Marinomonas sp. GJ51-6]WOD08448.1 hypothetical protein ONZ50_04935 [Marinomonas sp. GJ51-6]
MKNDVAVPREKLEWSLLGLRLGVFIVLLMWTLDKFVNPEHAAIVFKAFYSIPELSSGVSYLMGGLQLALILSFLMGFQKRWVTLVILIMHLSLDLGVIWSLYGSLGIVKPSVFRSVADVSSDRDVVFAP